MSIAETSTSVEPIDLQYLGHAKSIAVWRVRDAIIDCGPGSCLPRLLDGLDGEPPRIVLLTHIHLDHAGAAGELVRRWPDLLVYVHPIGAPHLEDPTRLLKSVARLYGDEMDRLWGDVLPVPKENLRVLSGGETVAGFDVAYVPGHASHHIAFRDRASGIAFVGDAAGVRITPAELIMPHTPPPDIDLGAYYRSLDVLEQWQPTALGLAHFGLVRDVPAHLASLRARVHDKAELARVSGEEAFVARAHEEFEALDAPALADVYELDAPPDHSYLGLRRYWDKRGAKAAADIPDALETA